MKIKIDSAYQLDACGNFRQIPVPIAGEAARVIEKQNVSIESNGMTIPSVVFDIVNTNDETIAQNILLGCYHYAKLKNIVERYNNPNMMVRIYRLITYVCNYSFQQEVEYMEAYVLNKLAKIHEMNK